MTAPWLYSGTPHPGGDEVTLMEGTTFCISDQRGDLGTQRTSGLFVQDTRVIRTWRLTVEQRHLEPMRVHQDTPFAASFLLSCPSAGDNEDDVVVTRSRFVGDGMREDLTFINSGSRGCRLTVRLEVGADFSDLFEVKDGHERAAGEPTAVAHDGALELSLVREGAEFAVTVEPDPATRLAESGMHWEVELGPHGRWHTSVQVVPRIRGHTFHPHHRRGELAEHAVPAVRQREFRSSAPRLVTDDPALARLVQRSIDDLGALRIFDPRRPELPVVAAGAPWFMALFGRDSLLTSIMLLPIDASLARGTLVSLSSYQGRAVDVVTEEQPGRIPHEVRFGPAGTLALDGRSAYYGSADATPLFVVALGELARWHPDLVEPELVTAADQALQWMLTFGDPDKDGFIEYERCTDRGLVNQGWKDSWDGINFADGTLAQAPIALAEVQAYAFAAFRARAEIADAVGDDATSALWRDRAARLRARFNQEFWLSEQGWFAVGLDARKRPIDALTSNNGHCLWAGIADDDKAARVAQHLLSPEMFSGWGIRTLSTQMGAYNPLSYHNGSVWPHDTALCVSGLVRYGHFQAAQKVALGLLDASEAFEGRLPELFSGFDREDFPVPVPYPAACSPQAWAAASSLELVRALIGLEPGGEGLTCRPVLPGRLLPMQLLQLACRGERFDITVDQTGWTVHPSPSRSHG